ncbi:NADH-quinone oxidoreductase subunit NuoE [Candidatus Woesearchaeota archaeon]|nr:NADH-quinone oxidoreductase subunit NuoE [Candidatus Woesearchaeota archaeon]
MPYLRKVKIKNNEYYYLFHTTRDGDKFRKYSKYLGKDKPERERLQIMKDEFLNEIKTKKPEDIKPNVVEALQKIQSENGFLPKEELIRISHELDIPGTDIYGVATFYGQFKLAERGKYIVSVCTGTACHVKGSNNLLDFLEKYLKIKAGETTADRKITLEAVNCIGACARAPAIMINDNVYGELDEEKVKKIIAGLK